MRPHGARARSVRAAAWLALCLLLVACSAESPGPANDAGGASGVGARVANAGAGGSALGGSAGASGSGNTRCRAPLGMSGSPRTIEDAVALLNALPKPTTAACFIESLARPLAAFATYSTVSAQPAFSVRSPRVLFRVNQLVISVVIEGDSSRLVEFSSLIDDATRSIKGELELPLLAPVPNSAPYDRVQSGDGTLCGVCHGPDERVESIGFAQAYASVAFRPNPSYRVPLVDLAHERQICDPSAEPNRCQMLTAIFDGGTLSEAEFPDAMTLFF